ncbi:MAG: hypothetical protein B6D55_02450 [Candidatus Omnitrophica bacterium 4484_70.2]|nr:MAG: hypothetical protein B6D55_02450 [Candidatus Omnitrophica bacterium 4484_70.2]
MQYEKLKQGIESYVSFPPDAICIVYEQHKQKYSDYNILGQVYKILCKLVKTNWIDDESVNKFIKTAREAAYTILEITEEKQHLK